MRKIRKGRQSLRKALEVPNEIFRQAVNLTEAERYKYISLECATVIVRLIKELRIKQGGCIRVKFDCIDMKDYKYFGFSKSGKTKCARFEKRNVQKSGKTKRSKNFAHTTL